MKIAKPFACIPEGCRDQHLTMVPEYAKPFRDHDIRGVGIHEVVEPYEIRRVGVPWYLVLYTYGGAARYECGGKYGEIKEDELWVGPPNMAYRYRAIGEWKIISAALFDVEDLAHLAGEATHKSVAHPLKHLVSAVEAYLAESSHALEDEALAATALAEYISVAIRRELAPVDGAETNAAALELRRLWEAVNASADVRWPVPEMAQQLFVSVRQFQRMMRSQYGLTAEMMLRKVRMGHARELLLATSLPLAMIAEKAGYRSVYSFSKAFKKHFDCSPGAFRRGGYEPIGGSHTSRSTSGATNPAGRSVTSRWRTTRTASAPLPDEAAGT